ncbi:MAG: tail fiber domain-containing protein [Gemmatimonadota bacterium]
MRARSVCATALSFALLTAMPGVARAQSVLVEAKTSAGAEVATIRTDSMRLLVPLHLLVGGLLFPDGTLQTTAAGGTVSVTSSEIVDGTIVDADISGSAAIADTKLGTITSAGKVSNSATTATSANTASAIVARDAAGGFNAGYVTADSLHLVSAGLVFPDGTLQTTAAGGSGSVTSSEIVDGTIVDADISGSAAIADTKLGTISTAGKVANSATTAMSANTASAIVARDAAGGFSAGYVAVADSLRVGGEGSFLAEGSYSIGTAVPAPASGGGTRMMWYPEKAAFRAGAVGGIGWDADSVGVFSVAMGYNTIASNYYSTAIGNNTTARGQSSTSLGDNTHANGNYSTALGFHTQANGTYSTALGYHTQANGTYSTALGIQTIASGNESTALGYATTASGTYSAALGIYTTAQAYGSLAIGRYNLIQGSNLSWSGGDPLFVAGNGTSSVPSNALTLYKNGNLTIAGTLTQSSDARLKEDMEPLEGTLTKVMRLTPIRYHFRPGTGRPAGTQIGLTAQQVQPLFPELVKQDGDGYLSLSYANLSAVLVKAVQEQQAEIEPLQAQVKALKARNHALESELAALRASQSEILARLRKLEAGEGR